MEFILSFIVVTILVFYLIGVLGRALLGYWIRKKQKEFAQGGGNPFFQWRTSGAPRPKAGRPEGEITVEQTRVSQRKVKGGVGDYVEYEEVTESSEQTTTYTERP